MPSAQPKTNNMADPFASLNLGGGQQPQFNPGMGMGNSNMGNNGMGGNNADDLFSQLAGQNASR
jgi:hypothetical protein